MSSQSQSLNSWVISVQPSMDCDIFDRRTNIIWNWKSRDQKLDLKWSRDEYSPMNAHFGWRWIHDCKSTDKKNRPFPIESGLRVPFFLFNGKSLKVFFIFSLLFCNTLNFILQYQQIAIFWFDCSSCRFLLSSSWHPLYPLLLTILQLSMLSFFDSMKSIQYKYNSYLMSIYKSRK